MSEYIRYVLPVCRLAVRRAGNCWPLRGRGVMEIHVSILLEGGQRLAATELPLVVHAAACKLTDAGEP